MKIKHSLILLIIFVIIVPCTLVIATASYQCRESVMKLVKHNLSSTTSIRAESIDDYFKQREANMEIITRMPQLSYLLETKRSDNEQLYDRYLSNINNTLSSRADNQPYVDEILCVNKYDSIVAGSDPASIGQLFKYVPDAHEIPNGDFLISTLRAEDGSLVCYLAYPIFSDNTFQGYMIAIINKNYFKSVVTSDNLLKSEKIIILDKNNNVIASNAPYIDQPMSNMPQDNSLREQWDKIKFQDKPEDEINFQVKGRKQIGYYVYMDNIGVTVLACINKSSVDKEIGGTTLFIAIAVAVIGLFAMTMIFIFVRLLLKPVNGLLGVIERIESGDYNARYIVTSKGNGELTRIVNAFNGLVDTLTKKNNDLRQMNLDIKMTTENIPGGFMRCKISPDFDFEFVSDSYLKLLGCTRQELITNYDNKFMNTIYDGDRARVRFEIDEQFKLSDVVELEYRIITRSGELRWIFDKSQKVTDETGVSHMYCVLVDITSNKKTQEKLKQNDERFRIILEQSDNIIFEWDFKTDRLNYSPQWVGKFGYHPSTDNVLSVAFTEHAHPDDKKALNSWLHEVYTGKGNNTNTEVRFAKSDGAYLWTRIRSSVIYDNSGNAVKAIFLISDINADKEEIVRLTHEAHIDMLTGLFNKVTTQSKIEEYIAEAPEGKMGAFCILDLDNFKQINDTYGHLFGDSVLQEISGLLREFFPQPDIVGRIGGDEFIVFLTNVNSAEEVSERVDGLLKKLPGTIHGGGDNIQVSASMGVALYPDHGADFLSLYEHSDSALYVAKDSGKNRHAVYSEDIKGLSYVKTFETPAACVVAPASFKDNFCKTVLSVMYEQPDVRAGVLNVFEMIGRHYGISRVYLFENSDDNLSCTNTLEWCADDVPSRKHLFDNIPYSSLNMHQNDFDSQGLFCCNCVDDCNPDIYSSINSMQSVRAVLHCGIFNNGEFRGFVGFDDCNSSRFWTKDEIDILVYLSRLACVFLVKNQDNNKQHN